MKSIWEKEIAVVGVSENTEKYGFKIFKDLIENGYKVKGINPKDGKILGKKIYKNLKELEIVPDLTNS